MATDPDVGKLMKSLSFEVEAIPHDNILQLTSTANTTPLNVRIKVRKKRDAEAQNAVISVPKYGRAGGGHERIRLVSSDQTIMSFNMYMEKVERQIAKKQAKSFFARFKPGCLDSKNEDSFKYSKGKTEETFDKTLNTQNKSDHAIHGIRKTLHTPDTNCNEDNDVYFLGRCKPGGCLDPSFDEEKYSYKPRKSNSSFASKDSNINENTNIIKIKDKSEGCDQTADDLLNDNEIEKPIIASNNDLLVLKNKNIENIKKDESRTSSAFNTKIPKCSELKTRHSHSLITYPPAAILGNEELKNVKDPKKTKQFDTEDTLRNSFVENTENYYYPKKTSTESSKTIKSDEVKLVTKDILESKKSSNNVLRNIKASPTDIEAQKQIEIEPLTDLKRRSKSNTEYSLQSTPYVKKKSVSKERSIQQASLKNPDKSFANETVTSNKNSKLLTAPIVVRTSTLGKDMKTEISSLLSEEHLKTASCGSFIPRDVETCQQIKKESSKDSKRNSRSDAKRISKTTADVKNTFKKNESSEQSVNVSPKRLRTLETRGNNYGTQPSDKNIKTIPTPQVIPVITPEKYLKTELSSIPTDKSRNASIASYRDINKKVTSTIPTSITPTVKKSYRKDENRMSNISKNEYFQDQDQNKGFGLTESQRDKESSIAKTITKNMEKPKKNESCASSQKSSSKDAKDRTSLYDVPQTMKPKSRKLSQDNDTKTYRKHTSDGSRISDINKPKTINNYNSVSPKSKIKESILTYNIEKTSTPQGTDVQCNVYLEKKTPSLVSSTNISSESHIPHAKNKSDSLQQMEHPPTVNKTDTISSILGKEKSFETQNDHEILTWELNVVTEKATLNNSKDIPKTLTTKILSDNNIEQLIDHNLIGNQIKLSHTISIDQGNIKHYIKRDSLKSLFVNSEQNYENSQYNTNIDEAPAYSSQYHGSNIPLPMKEKDKSGLKPESPDLNKFNEITSNSTLTQAQDKKEYQDKTTSELFDEKNKDQNSHYFKHKDQNTHTQNLHYKENRQSKINTIENLVSKGMDFHSKETFPNDNQNARNEDDKVLKNIADTNTKYEVIKPEIENSITREIQLNSGKSISQINLSQSPLYQETASKILDSKEMNLFDIITSKNTNEELNNTYSITSQQQLIKPYPEFDSKEIKRQQDTTIDNQGQDIENENIVHVKRTFSSSSSKDNEGLQLHTSNDRIFINKVDSQITQGGENSIHRNEIKIFRQNQDESSSEIMPDNQDFLNNNPEIKYQQDVINNEQDEKKSITTNKFETNSTVDERKYQADGDSTYKGEQVVINNKDSAYQRDSSKIFNKIQDWEIDDGSQANRNQSDAIESIKNDQDEIFLILNQSQVRKYDQGEKNSEIIYDQEQERSLFDNEIISVHQVHYSSEHLPDVKNEVQNKLSDYNPDYGFFNENEYQKEASVKSLKSVDNSSKRDKSRTVQEETLSLHSIKQLWDSQTHSIKKSSGFPSSDNLDLNISKISKLSNDDSTNMTKNNVDQDDKNNIYLKKRLPSGHKSSDINFNKKDKRKAPFETNRPLAAPKNQKSDLEHKEFGKLEMAFTSYKNQENEIVIKSHEYNKLPQINVGDSQNNFLTYIPIGQSMVVPIDSDYSLYLKIGKLNVNKELTPAREDKTSNPQKIADREFEAVLHAVYLQHLVPLQETISSLKKDIDNLSSQYPILKKKRSVRIQRLAKKCYCTKRTF